jgi:hypothetical protein
MGTTDPYQPADPRIASIPQAQPLPEATPPGGIPPRPASQARPMPQAQPAGGAQPMPQARPIRPGQGMPQARPLAPGGGAPQARAPGQPAGAGPRPIVIAGDRKAVVRERDKELEEEEEVTSAAVKNSPPWLISAAVHMALLIILGLIVMAAHMDNRVSLDVSLVSEEEEDIWAEELGRQVDVDSPLAIHETEEMVSELAISDLPEVEDPFAAPPELELVDEGNMITSDIHAKIPGYALSGREEGSKRGLLGKYGGTRRTEEAVLAGLQWLAKQQLRDGSWSLLGPYSDGVQGGMDNKAAATAMALLAFQGAGNTTEKGRFKTNVVRGWSWLLKELDGNGCFYHEGPIHHRFYTQGQATIAICELYGMTQDKKYKEAAERALKYCVNGQSPLGGWRYDFQGDSDVSVTGWVVMAVQSAKMAGLEVSDDVFRNVERFLDKVAQHDGSRYPYRGTEQPTVTMTAEALLCRQYLGWPQDDARLVAGMEWITSPENLIDFNKGRNVYYWYYATQAAHHMEGDYWKRWNDVMREIMPRQQVQSGAERGSWDPTRPTLDQWAPHGGRLYVTCLSIYMLEVYYRHLPIYTKIYTPLLRRHQQEQLKKGAGD